VVPDERQVHVPVEPRPFGGELRAREGEPEGRADDSPAPLVADPDYQGRDPVDRPMAIREEKTTRARVSENRTKTRPVASAVTRSPTTDSATTRTFAVRVAGYMEPYPMVPIV
jgi:hypothetical protein